MAKIFDEIFVNSYLAANIPKGSLLAGTGTNSTYVPVGTNTQFLKSNSSATSGVAWTNVTIGSLSDVLLTGLTAGSFLQYSGTIWETTTTANFQIFGSLYTDASAEAVSSSTSITFTTKVSLTTPFLTSSHKYRVGWYSESNLNSTTNDSRIRILVNSTITLGDWQIEHSDVGADQWESYSGFSNITNLSGVNNIAMVYAPSLAGLTMQIRRARLDFFRVR